MYSSAKDLPKGIRSNLPGRAQELYRGVFNDVWKSCTVRELSEHDCDRYKLAHVKAWSAVKCRFERYGDGVWREIK